MTEKIYLFAQDVMMHSQLLKTLRRLRRHTKLGLFIDAEQIDDTDKWNVKLFGPKIYWKRKIKWEISNAK